jgi:FkbM family methyltransferase
MIKVLPTFFGPMAVLESDTRITEEIQQLGHWEFDQLLEILQIYEKFYADRSGTMLDIGCNIGSWTLPIAQRYKQNNILAIDCQQLALDCVSRTVHLNDLNNVRVDCCAVSDCCDQIKQHKIDYDWHANFGAYEFESPQTASDFNGKLSTELDIVSVRTIDSLSLINVVFVKLDIEGMEHKALAGAKDTIQRCRPFIVYEHHKTNRSGAEQLLKDLNYTIYNSIGQMTVAVPTILTKNLNTV